MNITNTTQARNQMLGFVTKFVKLLFHVCILLEICIELHVVFFLFGRHRSSNLRRSSPQICAPECDDNQKRVYHN